MATDDADVVVDLTALDKLIAAEIRAWMGRQDVTQAWLAEQAGVHPSKLSRRLDGQGSFTANELGRIAKALGTTVNDLWPADFRNRCITLRAVPMPAGQMQLNFGCLGGHSIVDETGEGNNANGLCSVCYQTADRRERGRRLCGQGPTRRVPSGPGTARLDGLHNRTAGVLAADAANDFRRVAAGS